MNIQTHKTPWHIPQVEAGWGNGYIGLPIGHPWFGKHYDDIECSVHGGLTYSKNHVPNGRPDGLWWIGFDTGHYQDTKLTCPESYVDSEIESMKQQALAALNQH